MAHRSLEETFVTAKEKRKPDDPAQYKRFVEAARKAGADESEGGADRAFKKVVLSQTQHRLPRSPKAVRSRQPGSS